MSVQRLCRDDRLVYLFKRIRQDLAWMLDADQPYHCGRLSRLNSGTAALAMWLSISDGQVA
jgi:hypothetical protein